MAKKFELVDVGPANLTIDISELLKADNLWFNATEMAKCFGKRVQHYLDLDSTQEFISELIKDSKSRSGRPLKLVKTRRGRYGGTWLHHELALDFAMWLSPAFKVKLLRFVKQKLKDAALWRTARSEAKTGFLPMTDAIQRAHDPVQFYHYSNEADLINRIIFGKTAKQIREQYDGASPRDIASEAELHEINRLQIINTGLIEIGMPFEERKAHLEQCFRNAPLLVHDDEE